MPRPGAHFVLGFTAREVIAVAFLDLVSAPHKLEAGQSFLNKEQGALAATEITHCVRRSFFGVGHDSFHELIEQRHCKRSVAMLGAIDHTLANQRATRRSQ